MNILPLSKSTYQDFKKCPMYAYNRKVNKINPPVGDAAIKGVQFHKCISDLVNGEYEETVRSKVTYPEVNDWLTLTMVNRPLKEFKKNKAESEVTVLATRNLELSLKRNTADLIGIMDMIWLGEDKATLYIMDWKTGSYENDSEIERNMYAALGKALHPNVRTIIFQLYFVQSNRTLQSTYSWASHDKVMVIKDPTNAVKIYRESLSNPMTLWINDIVDEVESSDGSPTPGRQCRSWYGQECFFLQEHCPAYKNGRKIRNA